MTTEHEAKFYPVDKEIIRHALRDVSAICTHPERQMRRTMANSIIETKYPGFLNSLHSAFASSSNNMNGNLSSVKS